MEKVMINGREWTKTEKDTGTEYTTFVAFIHVALVINFAGKGYNLLWCDDMAMFGISIKGETLEEIEKNAIDECREKACEHYLAFK